MATCAFFCREATTVCPNSSLVLVAFFLVFVFPKMRYVLKASRCLELDEICSTLQCHTYYIYNICMYIMARSSVGHMLLGDVGRHQC